MVMHCRCSNPIVVCVVLVALRGIGIEITSKTYGPSQEELPTDYKNVTQRTQRSNCETLKSQYGFWSNDQCELWRFIENRTTIDMTPYQAQNIDMKDRFWSPKNNKPGSGKDGRLVYHLHLHKCMGTTFCKWFLNARSKTRFLNEISSTHCNVPEKWWYNKSQPKLHFLNGAYMGDTRKKMRDVYEQIRKKGWIMVASEGSLSDEPIFGEHGPFYYSVILREPISWVISMFHYDRGWSNKHYTLDTYLKKKIWGVPDFFTRRICGSSCVHLDPLTVENFLQAKSRLDHFDLVMVQDMVKNVGSTKIILKKEFPDLIFRNLQKKENVQSYSHQKLTNVQLQYIHNLTLMDKVLYEYAKILHQKKLDSYAG